MHTDLAIVLGLLCAAIAMFVVNRPRMDAVALIMLTVLPFTGVITINEALSGFSDSNIVLIAALFVIGDGLVRTGVARRLGDWLISTAGGGEIRLIALLMMVVCLFGSIMSSTAVTAIFIPVALRIAQSTKVAPSRLMMPLSFAALISGMTTLIATAPNLVVNSELIRHGIKGFHFFSFTPFGIPILAIGIVYMIAARHWLVAKNDRDAGTPGVPKLRDWVVEYRLADREHRLRVTDQSPLAGKCLETLNLRKDFGANIVAIERKSGSSQGLIQPLAKTALCAGDVLFIDLFAADADIQSLQRQYLLDAMPLSGAYFTDRSQEIGMAEVILPPNSDLVGKSMLGAKFHSRYGLTMIGLKRGIVAQQHELANEKLKIGDTLLLIGSWKAIANLKSEGKNVVVVQLPAEVDEVLPAAGKAPQAIFCLVLVVALMISGIVPNVQAALIGCLLMGALGVIDLPSAYGSIDWKTIVLIVGMLPFSSALQRTGGVELGADALMTVTAGAGLHVVLAVLFAVTSLLGLFISNTATAVLMAPVAIAVAKDLNCSPYPFAMIVALAASTAFMTPVSSPVNTLVVGPGNYTFGDFMRVGAPLTLIVMAVSILMVPWLLPF